MTNWTAQDIGNLMDCVDLCIDQLNEDILIGKPNAKRELSILRDLKMRLGINWSTAIANQNSMLAAREELE